MRHAFAYRTAVRAANSATHSPADWYDDVRETPSAEPSHRAVRMAHDLSVRQCTAKPCRSRNPCNRPQKDRHARKAVVVWLIAVLYVTMPLAGPLQDGAAAFQRRLPHGLQAVATAGCTGQRRRPSTPWFHVRKGVGRSTRLRSGCAPTQATCRAGQQPRGKRSLGAIQGGQGCHAKRHRGCKVDATCCRRRERGGASQCWLRICDRERRHPERYRGNEVVSQSRRSGGKPLRKMRSDRCTTGALGFHKTTSKR